MSRLQQMWRLCLLLFTLSRVQGELFGDTVIEDDDGIVMFADDNEETVYPASPSAALHGGWSVWGSWESCDKPCDGGVRTRTRNCDNPAPALTGRDCPGETTETESCNTWPCHGVLFSFGPEEGDSCYSGSDEIPFGPFVLPMTAYVRSFGSKTIYISPNGLLCLQHIVEAYAAPKPGFDRHFVDVYCIAAFFTDLSTETSGRVCYNTHDFTESGGFLNQDESQRRPFGLLQRYIASVDFNFVPDMCIVVTWDRARRFSTSQTVTIQLIYCTNGIYAYAFVFYMRGGMLITSGGALVGTIADGNIEGVYLMAMEELRADTFFNTAGRSGAYAFVVRQPQFPGEINYEYECRRWRGSQLTDLPRIRGFILLLPACPCNQWLAWHDPLFRVLVRTPSVVVFALIGNEFYNPYTQFCVYDQRGRRVTLGKSSGSFVYWNPLLSETSFFWYDGKYRDICCNRADSCEDFFSVRPRVQRCSITSSFYFGWCHGDPHLTTLDGKTYTFNGHGEYVLFDIPDTVAANIRTDRFEKDDGTFSEATVVSAIAVKDSNGTFLQVEFDANKTGIIIFAGNDAVLDDFTKDFRTLTEPQTLDNGITMEKDNQMLIATFENGITFNITASNKLLTIAQGILVSYRGQSQGLLGNFNGNPDDDFIKRGESTALPATSSDKAIFEFGQTWQTTADDTLFRYIEGKTWSTYNFPTFVPKFLDEADPDVVRDARRECKNDTQCTYDLVFTGKKEVALQTLETDVVAAEVKAIESMTGTSAVISKGALLYEQPTHAHYNESPTITAQSGTTFSGEINYLYVLEGQTSTFAVNASDDGPTITYELASGSSFATLAVDAQEETKAQVNVSLPDASPRQISVSVADDQGVSAALDVVMVYCSGCSGHGTCNYTVFRDDARATDFFKYATCECEIYWDGNDCEYDFDGCATSACSFNRTCSDVAADVHRASPTMDAVTCSPCPSGYASDTASFLKCYDVDECDASSPCSQICNNNVGGYTCSCNPGYRLAEDGTTCNDINECNEGTSKCPQICTNTVGSFTCTCHTGYTYNAADNTCTGSPPASCSTIDCSQADGCTETEDTTPVCFCAEGYKLESDNTCTDYDECDMHICAQNCTNTEGSFTCSCHTGYTLKDDMVSCEACVSPFYGDNCGSRCVLHAGVARCDPVKGLICKPGFADSACDDINECTDDPSLCAEGNKVCVNTVGSYSCQCYSGYQLDSNDECVDVVECDDADLNNCAQVCINTMGSFTCSCNTGYRQSPTDSTGCIDIDECEASSSGCEQRCINTPGRFRCECSNGYVLNEDRNTCTQVTDPCVDYPGVSCSQICNVENDKPICSCNIGYTLGTDDQTCIDTNECSSTDTNLCSKSDSCVNSDGGYECSCDTGSKLEQDGRTCTACDDFHYGVNCATECACETPGATRCDALTGCTCGEGWTGSKCEVDRDECAADTSLCTGNNEKCVNTPGLYQCMCQDGYQRNDAGACVDIDECSTSFLNDCSQDCTNTPGGYTCSCNSGFLQAGNQCNDINECEGQHGCAHLCENNIGNYRCKCYDGFKLDLGSKRQSCIPEEECVLSPCNANADCTSIGGVDSCVCKKGYTFATGSTTNCEDIQECSQTPSPCSQSCVEQSGGYRCECDQLGYKLDADQRTCTACQDSTFGLNCAQACTCDPGHTDACSPVNGACTCVPGWTGGDCSEDVNECSVSSLFDCSANSKCTNTPGSYRCVCDAGYVKSADSTCQACSSFLYGVDCASDCACEQANTASCDAITGGCTCKSGWTGTTCTTDVNECTSLPNICNDNLKLCQNTQGSHRCVCRNGYTINDRNICIDTDECLLGTDDCPQDQECTNTAGSFACACFEGYSLNGTRCTLDVVDCETFIIANGPCDTDYECVMNGAIPQCEAIEKTEDDFPNFPLILGLGLGIPLFLLAILISTIVFFCIQRTKQRRQYYRHDVHRRSFNNGFFPSTIPTKFESAGMIPRFKPFEDDTPSSSHSGRERNRNEEEFYHPAMSEIYGWPRRQYR